MLCVYPIFRVAPDRRPPSAASVPSRMPVPQDRHARRDTTRAADLDLLPAPPTVTARHRRGGRGLALRRRVLRAPQPMTTRRRPLRIRMALLRTRVLLHRVLAAIHIRVTPQRRARTAAVHPRLQAQALHTGVPTQTTAPVHHRAPAPTIPTVRRHTAAPVHRRTAEVVRRVRRRLRLPAERMADRRRERRRRRIRRREEARWRTALRMRVADHRREWAPIRMPRMADTRKRRPILPQVRGNGRCSRCLCFFPIAFVFFFTFL